MLWHLSLNDVRKIVGSNRKNFYHVSVISNRNLYVKRLEFPSLLFDFAIRIYIYNSTYNCFNQSTNHPRAEPQTVGHVQSRAFVRGWKYLQFLYIFPLASSSLVVGHFNDKCLFVKCTIQIKGMFLVHSVTYVHIGIRILIRKQFCGNVSIVSSLFAHSFLAFAQRALFVCQW